MAGCCRLLEPLYDRLKQKILESGYIQADESPIKVLENEKRGSSHRGYHWVYHDPVGRRPVQPPADQVENDEPRHEGDDRHTQGHADHAAGAGADAGNTSAVQHGLDANTRAAALFLTNKENMVAATGHYEGTALNSDRQLWSVAGTLAGTYRVLFKQWQAAGYRVRAIEKFGHDPRYPVTSNWPHLRDQLIQALAAHSRRVHTILLQRAIHLRAHARRLEEGFDFRGEKQRALLAQVERLLAEPVAGQRHRHADRGSARRCSAGHRDSSCERKG